MVRKMQAVLILAHKDPEQVLNLAKRLSNCFNVYIHFDVKCRVENSTLLQFHKIKNVLIFQSVDVRWGGYSITKAELLLLKEAMKCPENRYFHIISGQDWPILKPEEIYNFYADNENIYMKYGLAEGVVKSYEPIILWQRYYFNYDEMNRRSFYGKIYHRLLMIFHAVRGTDKFRDLDIKETIYQGANWCDLPRYAVDYSFQYLDEHPSIREMLKTGFCSDEFIFQTILCNSVYKNRIVNNNHRFVIWKKKYNNYPAVLDDEDFPDIHSSGAHFARKFDRKISKNLINHLDEAER